MLSRACIDFSISQERDEHDKGKAIVHHNGGTYRYIIAFMPLSAAIPGGEGGHGIRGHGAGFVNFGRQF